MKNYYKVTISLTSNTGFNLHFLLLRLHLISDKLYRFINKHFIQNRASFAVKKSRCIPLPSSNIIFPGMFYGFVPTVLHYHCTLFTLVTTDDVEYTLKKY